MNDTHRRRPCRARATSTARPRPDAEPGLPSIPVPPGPADDSQAPDDELPDLSAAAPRWGRIAQVARARRRWILAGGAVAAGIPASQGVAWAIMGRPDAVPLLAVATVFALATGIPYVASMYEAGQKTRRKELEWRPINILAAALGRGIDDAHTWPQNVSGAEEIEETRRVRRDARQLLADMGPILTVLLEQTAVHRGQPPEAGQETDHTSCDGPAASKPPARRRPAPP